MNKKIGNRNALKNKETGEAASSTVIFKCTKTQKSSWIESSRSEGKKLTEWIIGKLSS